MTVKAPALLPALSIDDYVAEAISPEFLISQGRYGVLVFVQASELLNLSYYATFFIGTPLSVFLWVLFFTYSAKYLRLSPGPQLLLAILVASLHPYMAEIFTFRIATFSLAVSLLLSTAIFYLFGKHEQTGKFYLLLVAGACVLALGTVYQSLLNFIAVIFLFKLLMASLSLTRKSEAVEIYRSTILHLVTVALASGVYLTVNRFIQNMLEIAPTSRSQLIESEEIPYRFDQIGTLIWTVFVRQEPVLGFGAKLVFWFIIAIGLFGILATRKSRVVSDIPPLVSLIASALLVLGFLVMVPGLIFAFSDWWPVPRVIAHTSLYFAAGVYMALMAVKGRKLLEPLNASLSVLLVLSLSFFTLTIFQDQQKLNQLDRETAQTMGGIIKSQTPLEKITSLEVIGAKYFYPGEMTTTQGDLNVSAFGAPYTKTLILENELGLSLIAPTDEQKELSLQHCKSVDPWPASGSVKVFSGHAVVCLGGG